MAGVSAVSPSLSPWLDEQRFRHRGSALIARLAKGLPFQYPRSLRYAIGRTARLFAIETGEPADLHAIEQSYFARLDVAKQRGFF